MALVNVKNVSKNLITLRLNSGQSLILPSGISVEVIEQEVEAHQKVNKLIGQNMISIEKKKAQDNADSVKNRDRQKRN